MNPERGMLKHRGLLRSLLLLLYFCSEWPNCYGYVTAGEISSALDVTFGSRNVAFLVRDRPDSNSRISSSVLRAKPGSVGPTTSIIVGNDYRRNKKVDRSRDTLVDSRRFVTLSQQGLFSVRANYGPFRSSQSLPNGLHHDSTVLSAHLATDEVPKDKPQLRVLFHFEQRHHEPSVCVRLIATNEKLNNSRIVSHCTAKDGQETCLGDITIPSYWWPTLGVRSTLESKVKHPKTVVNVSYLVYKMRSSKDSCSEKDRITKTNSLAPEKQVGTVPLVFPRHGYRQLGHDDLMHMLLPQAPMFPNSKFFVPILVENKEVDFESISIRSRHGIRLLDVQTSSQLWLTELDKNSKGTRATVTIRKRAIQPQDKVEDLIGPHVLFNWLFSVGDNSLKSWTEGKISWHVKYARRVQMPSSAPGFEENNATSSVDQYKLRATIAIDKDDVQKVLPIAKDFKLMNLAVLNGRQMSRNLKVFIVSEAGKIADVTLKSSCSSKDDSVLKVSSSCSSVYVDGSESRGDLNAEINVKYGSLRGSVRFLVWYPELPLVLDAEDDKLSLVKGWHSAEEMDKERLKRGSENLDSSESNSCKDRFQQTRVRVFCRFFAEDSDSGRKDFYPSRKLEIDVTSLIARKHLRVQDPDIAMLRGHILEGMSHGRTNIQVTSPINGNTLGEKEIRVTKSKETITGLNVKVFSGIHLDVSPVQDSDGIYVADTSFSSQLSSKYQEGLLDIEIHFSDGNKIDLKDVNPNDYYFSVKSLEPSIIAYSPRSRKLSKSHHKPLFPRVIVVGEGSGNLLMVSLELPDACIQKSAVPLASKKVHVSISLDQKKKSKHRDPDIKNVAQAVNMGDLGEYHNIALRDDQSYYAPAVSSSAHQFPSGIRHQDFQHHLTPLEIGMYVLLTVFCAAIAIFVASCFVYATKFNKQEYPLNRKSRSVQNAHDWVWLGKCTIDKASQNSSSSYGGVSRDLSVADNSSRVNFPQSDPSVPGDKRNSQRLSYVGSEINIIPNPRTEEYEAEVSAPNSPEEKMPMILLNKNQKHETHQLNEASEMPRKGHHRQEKSRVEHFQPLVKRPRSSHTKNLPPEYQPPRSSPYSRRSVAKQSKATSPMVSNIPKINSAAFMKQMMADSRPRNIPEPQRRLEQCRSIRETHDQDINFVLNPMERRTSGSTPLPASIPMNEEKPKINTNTFTKSKDSSLMTFNQSPMSPLDLPDPSGYLLSAPLKQSPASALPPLTNDIVEGFGYNLTGDDGQDQDNIDDEENPDIYIPSPPRVGTSNPGALASPFQATNDICTPITPEHLSPNHLFEIEELFQDKIMEQEADKAEKNSDKGNSRFGTFVKKKSNDKRPGEAAVGINPEVEDDEDDDFNLDYSQLVNYFDLLRESTA